jgi:hypothetical protein
MFLTIFVLSASRMPGLDGFSPVLPIRIPGLDENGPTTSVQLRRDGGFSALETVEKKGKKPRVKETTGDHSTSFQSFRDLLARK